MYTCPVCAYAALKYPPEDFTICPSCGTEFGYHDSNKSNAELRAAWVERGLPWSSRVIERPVGWNGLRQLQSAGLISVQEASVRG
jgi:hypothetical protein